MCSLLANSTHCVYRGTYDQKASSNDRSKIAIPHFMCAGAANTITINAILINIRHSTVALPPHMLLCGRAPAQPFGLLKNGRRIANHHKSALCRTRCSSPPTRLTKSFCSSAFLWSHQIFTEIHPTLIRIR